MEVGPPARAGAGDIWFAQGTDITCVSPGEGGMSRTNQYLRYIISNLEELRMIRECESSSPRLRLATHGIAAAAATVLLPLANRLVLSGRPAPRSCILSPFLSPFDRPLARTDRTPYMMRTACGILLHIFAIILAPYFAHFCDSWIGLGNDEDS